MTTATKQKTKTPAKRPPRKELSAKRKLQVRKGLTLLGERAFVCKVLKISTATYSNYLRYGVPLRVAFEVKRNYSALYKTKRQANEIAELLCPELTY